jgi:hypothetical protein
VLLRGRHRIRADLVGQELRRVREVEAELLELGAPLVARDRLEFAWEVSATPTTRRIVIVANVAAATSATVVCFSLMPKLIDGRERC